MRKKKKHTISKPLWTAGEIELLERQLREKVPVHLIHIYGRSRNAINNKLRRGNYIPKRKENRIWTARELETLMFLTLNQGLGSRRIEKGGYFPRRSVHSIAQQMRRKGWVNSIASQRCSKPSPIADQLPEFYKFIEDNSRSMTAEEIGRAWGVSRSCIKYHQDICGIQINWYEAIQIPSVRERLSKRRRKSNILHWKNIKLEQLKKFREHAHTIRRQRNHIIELKCMTCGRKWPKRKFFFYTTRKLLASGDRAEYINRHCRICGRSKIVAPLLNGYKP